MCGVYSYCAGIYNIPFLYEQVISSWRQESRTKCIHYVNWLETVGPASMEINGHWEQSSWGKGLKLLNMSR